MKSSNLDTAREWAVYALTDDLGTIRYVGKTFNIKTRLTAHITRARRTNSTLHSSNWIRSLLDRGHRPGIIVLERPETESQCFVREIFWISHYRSIGNDLCNISTGGDGPSGRKASMETRLLMSMSRKGKTRPPFTDAHRLAISTARMGRSYPHTDKSRAKIGASNTGKKKTLEMRLRIGMGRTRFTEIEDAEIAQFRAGSSLSKTALYFEVSIGCIFKCMRRHERRSLLISK